MHRRESNDPYYDLFEDWDLIVSSFLSQYGLRLSTHEFRTVSWDEFVALLSGISPETALGRIVEIRAEKDRNIIKKFSGDQKKIYDDWRRRKAEQVQMRQEVFDKEMQALEKTFEQICK